MDQGSYLAYVQTKNEQNNEREEKFAETTKIR